MSDTDPEGRDPEGRFREAQGGGGTSRGPNADPGGDIEPGGLVPPYEGRTTGRGDSESTEASASSVERQLGGVTRGGAGQTASPADESPVDPSEVTDRVPETPLGVGESINRRGEDIADDEGKESGRDDAGTQGASDRPVGTSTPRDASTVNPQES